MIGTRRRSARRLAGEKYGACRRPFRWAAGEKIGARRGPFRWAAGEKVDSAVDSAVDSVVGFAIGIAAVLVLAGCGTGTLATPDTTSSASASASASATQSLAAGPTLIVTVPDLPLVAESSAAAPPPASPVPATAAGPAVSDSPTEAPALEPEAAPTAEPAPTAGLASTAEAAPAATQPPAPPAGDPVPISLANCDGCSVLATHRAVSGDLSAALVGTQAGRAILLSVDPDGQVKGVIGVPYGASFAAPANGVLACDGQARCAVEGTQPDGRAILSAFELTETGAWRDVSGDDAFPSATERAGVIDLGGELGLAVQVQGAAAAVWMLYQWSGDRFTVVGCAPDGDLPPSAAQVSQDLCLS